MQLDLSSGILLIGIVQGLFLALSLVLHKPAPLVANRFLAALMLSFAIALLVHFLQVTELWRVWLKTYLLGSAVVFVFGPLLYLYTRQLTQPSRRFTLSLLLHFVPVCLNWALFIPLLFAPPESVINGIVAGQSADQGLSVLPLLKATSVVLYTLWSLKLWFEHAHRIRQTFSALEQKSLSWLRNLLLGFLSFETVFVVVMLADVDLSMIPAGIDSVLSLVLVVLIFMTGFYGLQQPEIFRHVNDAPVPEMPEASEAGKQKVSNLNTQVKAHIDAELDRVVRTDNLYTERFLDLRTLAQHVKVTPHQLSEYLNDVLKVNFYDYINGLRIDEAKRQLVASDTPILDVGLAVGFNNKATFNKAFKKHTAMTPSQYRKENQ
ncbi:helix-turn-helix domain-containing protein [Aestuariibacter halophilus]|uniref:Helix-turn-helix domain-containing protein n=1 Tax=Fluctibacter halophilus TaxID=226011 RepID=A0ABS8GC03_9ALTE|nr:helix-turn-helix domain-containing protein [Aestuariibacter halophilus]MCC2617289.1 helix-turn-helix domain-containing protein [Aestuariibacter halophilus]